MNEKKLGVIIVLVVALIAPVLALTAYAENCSHLCVTIVQSESLAIHYPFVNENIASLNASLTICNTGGRATQVNAVKVGQIAESCSPGVAVCVNGTGVDCAARPLFVIETGDTAVVNMIVPYTSFPYALSRLHSEKVVSITVFTDEAMYYVECNCTKN